MTTGQSAGGSSAEGPDSDNLKGDSAVDLEDPGPARGRGAVTIEFYGPGLKKRNFNLKLPSGDEDDQDNQGSLRTPSRSGRGTVTDGVKVSSGHRDSEAGRWPGGCRAPGRTQAGKS